MRFWERIRHRMDSHYGTYDERKTVITLTFNKRTNDDLESLADMVEYSLRPMSEWMKDLEIEIK
jgi:hypothetical protein